MNEYTHVILDEVHERGQEMDFLLLLVKRLLYTVSSKVKVVLMSATFKWQTFADYFLIPTIDGRMASAINIVKKEPTFTVKTFYLNNLTKFGSVSILVIVLGTITVTFCIFETRLNWRQQPESCKA